VSASPQNRLPGFLTGIILPLMLALGLRLLFWCVYDDSFRVRPDTQGYWTAGRNLVHHGVFSLSNDPPWRPCVMRTPVYPLFLALLSEGPFGLNAGGIAAIQIFLSLASIVGTGWLGSLLGGRPGGLIASLLLACDLASVVSANQLLTESLFAFLLLGWLLLCVQAERRNRGNLEWAGIGLLGGLLVLCRPISLFAAPLCAGWVIARKWSDRTRWIAGICLLAGACVLPGVWIARNWVRTGAATLSTIGVADLYAYRAAWVSAHLEHRSFEEVHREYLGQMQKSAGGAGFDDVQTAQVVRPEALRILFGHPDLMARQALESMVRLLLGPANAGIEALAKVPANDTNNPPVPTDGNGDEDELSARVSRTLSPHLPPWVVGLKGLSMVQLTLLYAGLLASAIGWRRFPRKSSRIRALLVLMLLGFMLFSSGAETNSRFRSAFAPLLCVLSGAGWGWVLSRKPLHAAPGGEKNLSGSFPTKAG